MLSASHLGGSRTGQDPQSKAHTDACLVSPSRAGHIETYINLCIFWLCCCCATASHIRPPGSVLVAVMVQQQPCCELSPLRWPHTVLLCVCACLCVSVSTRYVCCHEISTQQQHSSCTAPAVFQALPFVPVVTVLCVWLVHSRRSSQDNIFTSNATFKRTSSDLIPAIRSTHEQQKQ